MSKLGENTHISGVEGMPITVNEVNLVIEELGNVFGNKEKINDLLTSPTPLDDIMRLVFINIEKVYSILEIEDRNNLNEIKTKFFEYIKEKTKLSISFQDFINAANIETRKYN